ncbi:MAG: dihydrofolate reductase family protein [Methanoregula sp.]|jgi:dihydrofolate reductase|uniref:dihydrofolate reductase family protein n=1 Tax=Methanoregula sp. TaxID=2052170 RepID=UPI003D0B7C1D
MGKIIVFINLSLDGVMQAPARPDEDTRGGFTHGGWAAPYAAMPEAGEAMANAGGLLLGRTTYEDFYNVWPQRTYSPFSSYMDNTQKYVVSRTLKEPLPWKNSTLINGDVAKTLSTLKKEQKKDLVIMGSGELIRSLMPSNLIDEYVLLVHPLVLGEGRRLFDEGIPYTPLKLIRAKTTDKGVIIATYQPA